MEEVKNKFEIFNIDGTDYLTELNIKFLNRKPYQEPDPKKILAFIPGTIQEIFVEPKQEVKIGDDLLILDAMKMRNKLTAPLDGIIKAIYIKTGEVVPKNKLILEYE